MPARSDHAPIADNSARASVSTNVMVAKVSSRESVTISAGHWHWSGPALSECCRQSESESLAVPAAAAASVTRNPTAGDSVVTSCHPGPVPVPRPGQVGWLGPGKCRHRVGTVAQSSSARSPSLRKIMIAMVTSQRRVTPEAESQPKAASGKSGKFRAPPAGSQPPAAAPITGGPGPGAGPGTGGAQRNSDLPTS